MISYRISLSLADLFHLAYRTPSPFMLLQLAMFYSFLKNCMYLFLAAQGLRCCTRAFSSSRVRGLLFLVVHGLIVVASLVAELGL